MGNVILSKAEPLRTGCGTKTDLHCGTNERDRFMCGSACVVPPANTVPYPASKDENVCRGSGYRGQGDPAQRFCQPVRTSDREFTRVLLIVPILGRGLLHACASRSFCAVV